MLGNSFPESCRGKLVKRKIDVSATSKQMSVERIITYASTAYETAHNSLTRQFQSENNGRKVPELLRQEQISEVFIIRTLHLLIPVGRYLNLAVLLFYKHLPHTALKLYASSLLRKAL
jgi:hypothetical protein